MEKLSAEKIQEIIDSHGKWLRDEKGGSRANLSGANLSDANLSNANLRNANLSGADLSGADLSDADLSGANLRNANLSDANLSGADLSDANLSGADLSDADLSGANLRNANLRNADLDFSCLPLWCGSLNMIVDKKQSVQILYHFCSLKCDDEEVKQSQKQMFDLANQFHRVDECGKLGE